MIQLPIFLENELVTFLDKNYDQGHTVLLGLSGGADSLALFYLLLKYKIEFAVAHIDHRWREESQREAIQLLKLAEEFQIPFHLKTLNPESLSGNLEEACRHERLSFFSTLCQKHHYQAVLLGHHADDQSETVLKGLLEGRGLPYLGGIKAVSRYEDINIWRPFLSCTKSQILEWLAIHQYQPFEDKTNFDPKYLRARFRTKIIPELAKDFGKEIASNLNKLGKESEELKDYLDQQVEGYWKNCIKGPFGLCLDLSETIPSSDYELKYLIKKACEVEGISFPRHFIEDACQKVRAKVADRQLFSKEGYLYLDRGRLFILKSPLKEFTEEIPIKIGEYIAGDWKIHVQEISTHANNTLNGWNAAWKGALSIQIPQGNYVLKKGNASISKWWTDAKVPAFMRYAYPSLWDENQIMYEFLSQRGGSLSHGKTPQWAISLTYNGPLA